MHIDISKEKPLNRIIKYIENNPDANIYLVAQNSHFAREYIDYISQNTNIKKNKITILTSHGIDGSYWLNGLLILAGHWFENHIYDNEGFQRFYIKNKDMYKVIMQELEVKIDH